MTGRSITSKHLGHPAQLQAAGRQLGIVSQLGEELLQARWIALLRRIGRDAATRLLSFTQALDATLIQRYERSWDWELLSRNETLPWSLELIERYEDRWVWGANWLGELSESTVLPWSLGLIERFEDRWDWNQLSANEALPWSPELIERFESRWDWELLSDNEALPWSLELIERYGGRWKWDWLSGNKALPWSLELIERYGDRWYWGENEGGGLSGNEALPWSLELIERYEDRWDWGRSFGGNLSGNKALPWSPGLIERYEDHWNWTRLSENEALPGFLELIERFDDRLDWSQLSGNEGRPWSVALIERFADRWHWGNLSHNKALPWSPELIERHEGRWYWGENDGGGLSGNEALPWSLELIERYEDRWDWDGLRDALRRTKVLVLSSSAIDEIMTHYASSNGDDCPVDLEMAEALAPAAGLDWEPLRAAVAACTRCALHATRTQTVFGVGNRNARCMFIGEAPGALEERQGEPFVGPAGELLDSMIHALGLQRADVFIANILKCRPPGNREPKAEEVLQCRGYLDRQIELVSPMLIVAVGRIAAQNLLATDAMLARLRGKVHAFGSRSRPLVVTYHPAYLLRSPSEKRKAWQDLLIARQILTRVEHEGGVAP